ncbi:MAG: PDZ domain-containing protein [Akkermansiaceae bacterium]|nr:PDZ domain-containing protein [Akkermansiaceae bacterium]
MRTTIRFITPLLCLSAAAITPLAAQDHAPRPAASHAVPAARPLFGVATERISDELRHQLPHLQPGAGLIVRGVMPGSPADQAGVETLDILLHWNHQILVLPEQLQILVSSAKPGDQASFEFLHRGVVTRATVTLAPRPEPPHRHQPAPPAASHHPRLSPDLMKQAAEAFGQSGIDPHAIGQAMKGLKLGNIDPNAIAGALDGLKLEDIDSKAIEQALKGIDLGTIAKALEGFHTPAPEPANPTTASKIVLIAPDGTRTEIPLDKALQPGGSPADALKGIDFSKLDPATILSGKILLIQPDGTEQQLNPGDLLKNSGAIEHLLKGLGDRHP